ncbi:MAG: hypothetical protein H6621_03850 [Halobacteriovoraceae bacterium]|nr:hypothetical protein [Halobacteriovoraceae bacterium]MCB9094182.1 hypothetical protein [Halobacteriovoraceae bacterium]
MINLNYHFDSIDKITQKARGLIYIVEDKNQDHYFDDINYLTKGLVYQNSNQPQFPALYCVQSFNKPFFIYIDEKRDSDRGQLNNFFEIIEQNEKSANEPEQPEIFVKGIEPTELYSFVEKNCQSRYSFIRL